MYTKWAGVVLPSYCRVHLSAFWVSPCKLDMSSNALRHLAMICPMSLVFMYLWSLLALISLNVLYRDVSLWKKSVMHACCCIPCFANSMKTIIEFYTFIIVIVKYYTDTLYDEKETKLRVCLRRKETCPWLKYIVVCNLIIQNGGSI